MMASPLSDGPDKAPAEAIPLPRRVGHVGLAGAPNVGKSTLINRLVGQKVAIVSERPQTTRERSCGILTDDHMQLIFIDLPGISEPRDRLGKLLLGWVTHGLRHCNVVLHLRDARRSDQADDPRVMQAIRESGKRVWLAWNKIDRVPHWTLPALSSELPYERRFGVSGLRGDGLDELVTALAEAMPIRPLLYDAEQVSDRDLRFLVAELVREQVFRRLGQEVPYGIATQVETFDETREDGKIYLKVWIVTEREAHKPIIIGKGGSMLKAIGQAARLEIERLLEAPAYLDLWVKVRPKWRSDPGQLNVLGLRPPNNG
jgi:GTP-binding protein Era